MNIERLIDDLLPYIDQPYKAATDRTFPRNVPIHEAGHAIVCESIREVRPCAFWFVEPETGADYGIAGEITPETTPPKPFTSDQQGAFPLDDTSLRIAIKTCAISLAGFAAEAIASDNCWRYTLRQRHVVAIEEDGKHCEWFCTLIDGLDFKRIALTSWALAWRILEARWPDVEALAASIQPTNPPPHVRSYFASMEVT